MTKIAFIFPGQGSQYVGMGKELYEQFPQARDVFDAANDILGFDLKKIIFEGPEDILRQTRYTQPAIFATSIAAFKVFAARYAFSTDELIGAGHSLGEYSALCAAGAFNVRDGIALVKARGEFIQRASEQNPGTMAAIIGLEKPVVEEVCAQARGEGACEAVNFNSPGQIVIAGAANAVQEAIAAAQEKGASKAILLNVSGPFHSSLMDPASSLMRAELERYAFNTLSFPVVTNCDAALTTDPSAIKEKLAQQINHPVLWEDSVRNMIAGGSDLFIEIGPQRVLSGLLRRIDKTMKSSNIEDAKTLEKILETLQANKVT